MGASSSASLGAGERIKRLRGRFGLTQVQFAELMGVSFASVNRWENGQSNPSALAWQRIFAAEEHGLAALSPIVRMPKSDGPRPGSESALPIDFASDSEVVRTVAEAERLSHGYIFNPAFATEISLIDPLPHQRIAVYEHMLPQPRLRFLLADDAGAGKTIMAGPVHPRDASAPPDPPSPHRSARRPGRQLGERAAQAVRPALQHRRRRRRPGRATRSPGPTATWSSSASTRWPASGCLPGFRNRASSPTTSRSSTRPTSCRRRPPARLHDPQDRPLPGRRSARRRPHRRPASIAWHGLATTCCC